MKQRATGLAFRVGLEAFGGAGPTGEREAVDLGVVADVDGKFLAEVEKFDRGGRGVLERELAEFAGEGAALGGVLEFDFDDDGGALLAGVAEADEGAAGDAGVLAEDLFDGFGEERAGGGLDALDLAAAKPEAVVGVKVAAVAEAVEDACAAGVGLRVGEGDFRRGGRGGVVVVFAGDDGAADDDFADFAAGEFAGVSDRGDGGVGDRDDADVYFGERPTDAGAGRFVI